MSIKARIRELRTANKLTQDQFAEICGASKSAVSQWESGRTLPTIANIAALSRRLAFSIDWLITGEGSMAGTDVRAKRLGMIYSSLDDRGKDAVLRVAEAVAPYPLEEKKK
jgi:transcriptional regulator with XRE-family HTH domain